MSAALNDKAFPGGRAAVLAVSSINTQQLSTATAQQPTGAEAAQRQLSAAPLGPAARSSLFQCSQPPSSSHRGGQVPA
jgi:hypothetical protein